MISTLFVPFRCVSMNGFAKRENEKSSGKYSLRISESKSFRVEKKHCVRAVRRSAQHKLCRVCLTLGVRFAQIPFTYLSPSSAKTFATSRFHRAFRCAICASIYRKLKTALCACGLDWIPTRSLEFWSVQPFLTSKYTFRGWNRGAHRYFCMNHAQLIRTDSNNTKVLPSWMCLLATQH